MKWRSLYLEGLDKLQFAIFHFAASSLFKMTVVRDFSMDA